MGKKALALTCNAANETLYIRTYAKEGEMVHDYYQHAFVKYLQCNLCMLNSFRILYVLLLKLYHVYLVQILLSK